MRHRELVALGVTLWGVLSGGCGYLLGLDANRVRVRDASVALDADVVVDASSFDADESAVNPCEGANLASDPNNCGVCGRRCLGTVCLGGSCTNQCLQNRYDCVAGANGCETDISSDPTHCGGCAIACAVGQRCIDGQCTCAAGTENCDGVAANGCETQLRSDVLNCGACGRRCGQNQVCVVPEGSETPVCACSEGFEDCDGFASNGCEAGTQRGDLTNCGACGVRCVANQACSTNTCVCAQNFGDCDEDALNGCETDMARSMNHCGRCGNRCGGNSSCVSGRCVCAAGFDDCDGDPSNGCEVALRTVENCGTCGNRCSSGVTPYCDNGRCSGFCIGVICPSGSCVDLQTDRANCGECGHACGENTVCENGECVCLPGWLNCNGDMGDGCESSRTALTSCGSCRHMCFENQRCDGIVAPSCRCTPGYGDCDGVVENGCETYLLGAPGSCGTCGHSCGANEICANGSCTCSSGLRDCDPGPGLACRECCGSVDCNDGMGCNVDVCVDGRCMYSPCAGMCCGGMVCQRCCLDRHCGDGSICEEGACVAGCRAGMVQCGGSGRCIDLLTDALHCGGCNTSCGGTAPLCCNGMCRASCP